MEEFVSYLFPILKFLGIFGSGLLGATGLVVDFKKDGIITPWGKKALIGIVLSFLVTATIQGFEIYQSSESALLEELKTQKMLFQIQKTLHPLDPRNISAEFSVEFPSRSEFGENSTFFISVDSIVLLIQRDSTITLPEGTKLNYANTYLDDNQEEEIIVPWSLVIHENSPLFPKLINDTLINDTLAFRSFIHQGLDFEFYKKGNYQDIDSLRSPDISLSMMGGSTVISYDFKEKIGDIKFEIYKSGLLVDIDRFRSSNKGTVESLLDLSDAVLRVSLVDDDYLYNSDYEDYSSKSEIQYIRLYIGNREFFLPPFIRKVNQYGSRYISKFPNDILQGEIEYKDIQQLTKNKQH